MADADLLVRATPVFVPTRHRFSADDLERAMARGAIDPDGRFELIDGDIIVMPYEGEPHADMKSEIIRHLNRTLNDSRRVMADTTLMLSKHDCPSPDAYVFELGARARPIDIERLHLVVEVADTSLSQDLNEKLPLYARHGVREYWIVDVRGRRTLVFRSPAHGAYPAPETVPFSAVLRVVALPELALRIDSLRVVGAG